MPPRNVRRHAKHEGLVKRLGETAHPRTGASLFPTFRELACFAAVLGFELDRRRPLEAGASTEVLVDGRIFANGPVAVDILYLVGLAATRDQDILLDESAQEERLVDVFEAYMNGGLEILNEWLEAEPSDPDGDRALIAAMRRSGFLDTPSSAGSALEDARF